MAQFALTYGSFGDLLETAKLAVKVVKLLRADGRKKLSQERLALAAKLQTLNSDLITLDSIAAGVHIDLSSTHTLLVVIRVRAEVDACRMVLAQFLDRLAAPRGFLGSIIVALSEENELARFRTEISSPMKGIRTLMSMLNLATSQGLKAQLDHAGSQLLRVGDKIDHLGDRLAAYHDAILSLPIARGVSDNIFCVVDPVGGNIPISLRYCHLYSDLDRIIKAYMENRPEAGGLYVQRGDYNIVSSEGSIISPMEFSETVKAGMQVEMSIIKRTFHAWRERRAQSNTSPPDNAKAREWFICANPACGRKYEINEHNGEILSPEVAQDRFGQENVQPEVFRLVQYYTVQFKGPVQVKGRQGFITQFNNYFQARLASQSYSWTELFTGPAHEMMWTVQLKGTINIRCCIHRPCRDACGLIQLVGRFEAQVFRVPKLRRRKRRRDRR
ncbi:hypothetical protein B0H14DRAFT_2693269 [Mycena olivaceomarginata]|nr:hypothetical protein B0H14DRAFT_2693269 [Mycena olivaceomarginata]